MSAGAADLPATHGAERQRALLIALWLVSAPFLCLLYLTAPPSPDQSQFDYMGWLALNGGPFYVGSFDMNWPGKMALHALGIRLFGVEAWTWRLTDFLLMQALAAAAAWFLWRAGWRMAPFIFLALYPAIYVTAGFWTAGQRDIVAAGFLFAAAGAAMPGGRGEGWRVLLAGACVGYAVLIRPTYLTYLVGLMLLEALPLATPLERRLPRVARAILYPVGAGLVLGAMALSGLWRGNFDDFWAQSFVFSLSIYVGEAPQDLLATVERLFLRSWHWFSGLGALGLALWLWRDRASHAVILAIGMGATFVVSFLVQNKGFGYHLAGFIPLLVACTAVALDWLGARAFSARRPLATGLFAAAVLLVVVGTVAKIENHRDGLAVLAQGEISPVAGWGMTEADRQQVVEMIRAGSGPEAYVAQYGTRYALLYRAERRHSYRYFTPAADQIRPDFPMYAAWMAEVQTGLRERTPDFVVLDRRWAQGPADGLTPLDPDAPILGALLAHVAEGHRVAFETDAIILFEAVP
ncbi:MAG: hypothetical protein AAF771_09920 [Pseudomonadota bacterium]